MKKKIEKKSVSLFWFVPVVFTSERINIWEQGGRWVRGQHSRRNGGLLPSRTGQNGTPFTNRKQLEESFPFLTPLV